MNQASATYPAVLLLILLALALLPAVAADPAVVDGGGGIRLATWDFSAPGGYNATGVAFAPGNATLALTPRWTNDTSDAEFLASEDSATNVSVNSGLRLVNQARSLIQDGAFNQTVGPWTYANGSTGQVVSARDPGGSARLWHLTPRVQFDSMDSVFGTHPWTAVSSGKSSSTLSQSTFVRKEGTGSLRDDVTIGQQGGANWVGAIRDDPGTWNWSAYNRLGVWINVNASGLAASILLTNLGGQNWISWIPQSLSPGWRRYIFDISPSFGTNNQIDQLMVGFLGNLGKYTTYVDDLVLFNYTAFDETARVTQTFMKPDPTNGSPGTLSLQLDVSATPSVNVVSYLKVNVGGFAWSESPVVAGDRRCRGCSGGARAQPLEGVRASPPAEPILAVAAVAHRGRSQPAPRHTPLRAGGDVRAGRYPPHCAVPSRRAPPRLGVIPRDGRAASRHIDPLRGLRRRRRHMGAGCGRTGSQWTDGESGRPPRDDVDREHERVAHDHVLDAGVPPFGVVGLPQSVDGSAGPRACGRGICRMEAVPVAVLPGRPLPQPARWAGPPAHHRAS